MHGGPRFAYGFGRSAGRLTGAVARPILGREAKVEALHGRLAAVSGGLVLQFWSPEVDAKRYCVLRPLLVPQFGFLRLRFLKLSNVVCCIIKHRLDLLILG